MSTLVLANDTLEVSIDVRPCKPNNLIIIYGMGTIPVAILNEGGFDPDWVDPETATFGPTGEEASAVYWVYKDVDYDLDIDLVIHFKTKDAGFEEDDTIGILKAVLYDGTEIWGEDSITIKLKKF